MTPPDAATLAAARALAATLRRLAACDSRFGLQLLAPDRQAVSAEALLTPGAPELERMLDAHARALRVATPSVAASHLSLRYAGALTYPAVAAYALEGRVPDLAAANLVVRRDPGGGFGGFALRGLGLAVLAGDDLDGNARVRVVADRRDLAAWLRERLVDRHLALLVEALHGVSELGRRVLWDNVAVACLAPLTVLVRRADDPEAMLGAARELLAGVVAPLTPRVRAREEELEGRRGVFVERDTCCLTFRTPDGRHCGGCSRLSPEQRRRRRRLELVAG